MQNDTIKCGLTENREGYLSDENIKKDAYIWYETNWEHDKQEHLHQTSQLTYVEEGYQYLHIEQKIYLVPQNHVIWIPAGMKHRTTSEAERINLMVVMFKPILKNNFFEEVHVFAAPPILKEMLLYASKWNKLLTEDEEQKAFLFAMLNSLPNLCKENNSLQIPVPTDSRLIPVCNYINANYKYNFDFEELADKANISVRTLQRLFKQQTGITVQKYAQLIRILKSIELLDTKRYTLTEIAFKIGYQSLPAFSSSYFSIMNERPKVNR